MTTSRRQEREMFEALRASGARRDRDAIVQRFLPLARQLARRYQGGSEPLEDLEQVASLALVRAVDGFDHTRGTAFSSYAVPSIAGAIKRHFRDHGWSVRVPRDLQELSLRVERLSQELATDSGRPPVDGGGRRERRRGRRAGRRGARGLPRAALRFARHTAALGPGRRGRLAARHDGRHRREPRPRARALRAGIDPRHARGPRPPDRPPLLPGRAHAEPDRRPARPLPDAHLQVAPGRGAAAHGVRSPATHCRQPYHSAAVVAHDGMRWPRAPSSCSRWAWASGL